VRTWWTVPDVTAHPDVDRKLMVLTAPAGFGKPTVRSAWAAHRPDPAVLAEDPLCKRFHQIAQGTCAAAGGTVLLFNCTTGWCAIRSTLLCVPTLLDTSESR
jgi:hypothetical protein